MLPVKQRRHEVGVGKGVQAASKPIQENRGFADSFCAKKRAIRCPSGGEFGFKGIAFERQGEYRYAYYPGQALSNCFQRQWTVSWVFI